MCFVFFFLIVGLYFLILAIIAQMLNPTIEVIILLEILTIEEKPEIEIHIVTVKTKVGK